MRKLFTFIAALMLSAGLWAETQMVSYRYPVYNTEGKPASGIKEWKIGEVEATVVTNTTTTLNASWYVVKGTVQAGTLVCNGAAHLILADGANLTINESYKAGIQVSGDGNSLTIYGQTAQSGQLIAKSSKSCAGIGGGNNASGSNITINGGIITATGGDFGAGIGGGVYDTGSTNITINDGMVTANGGDSAAGIGGGNRGSGSNITINGGIITATGGDYGAGIGGGFTASASNITINGGIVTANGGQSADGIGGGYTGSCSDIFVDTDLVVRADGNTPPTTEIKNDGGSIASFLAGKRYATIKFEIDRYKAAAVTEITTARVGIQNIEFNNWINAAINDIQGVGTTTKDEVDRIKNEILSAISFFKEGKAEGKAEGIEEGKAAAKSALPTDPEGTAGPAVVITKGEKSVTLINPDEVTYKIIEEE